MLFVGIDIAKSKHDCCIIVSDCVIITDSLRISNSKEGFDSLYNTIISALGDFDISNVKIGLESTVITAQTLQTFCILKASQLLS